MRKLLAFWAGTALLLFGMNVAAGLLQPGASGGLASSDFNTCSEIDGLLDASETTGTCGDVVLSTSPTFATSALSPIWASTASDVADAGVLRLGNAESICLEASPTGTDTCVTTDTSENVVWSGIGSYMTVGTARYYTDGGSSAAAVAYGAGGGGTGLYQSVSGAQVNLAAGSTQVFGAQSVGVKILKMEQADVGAICGEGQLTWDTGGATDELCYCTATNTWLCAAFTAGPTD